MGYLVNCGKGACTASGMSQCVDGAVVDQCTPGEPALQMPPAMGWTTIVMGK